MGKQKKHLIKSINFGIVGNPSRTIVEKLSEQLGNKGFSEYIRKIVFLANNDKTEFKNLYVRKALIHDYDEINKKIRDLAKTKAKIMEEMENSGINPDSLI